MSACLEIAPDLLLDGHLALFHRRQSWLAVADLHFGFESNRRREGALWPMWGMGTVAERLARLVGAHRPETLVLVGDVVDGAAALSEAVAWLATVAELCERVVLVEGNHDRGEVRRRLAWVPSFATGGFVFEHGHLPPSEAASAPGATRVRGHLHPSVRMADGAGTSLRLPALVEVGGGGEDAGRELILPAFSPWAGGGRYDAPPGARVRRWACSPARVFEVPEEVAGTASGRRR